MPPRTSVAMAASAFLRVPSWEREKADRRNRTAEIAVIPKNAGYPSLRSTLMSVHPAPKTAPRVEKRMFHRERSVWRTRTATRSTPSDEACVTHRKRIASTSGTAGSSFAAHRDAALPALR
jgi:hypothetical protein